MNPELYATFVLAGLVVIATPGPDSLNTLAIGIARGRREGVAYALGVGLGCLTHTLWAVLGVSALVAAKAALFNVIKAVGVAYLLWLGVQALRDRGALQLPRDGAGLEMPRSGAAAPAASLRQRFMQGVLTNSLNPKVMLFFLAFLPQFVDPQVGSVAVQMLVMGASFAVLTTLAYCVLGWFAGSLGQRLLGKPGVGVALNRCTGVLFIALALRLALVDRK